MNVGILLALGVVVIASGCTTVDLEGPEPGMKAIGEPCFSQEECVAGLLCDSGSCRQQDKEFIGQQDKEFIGQQDKEFIFDVPAELSCGTDNDCSLESTDSCCGRRAVNKNFSQGIQQVCAAVCPEYLAKCIGNECTAVPV